MQISTVNNLEINDENLEYIELENQGPEKSLSFLPK